MKKESNNAGADAKQDKKERDCPNCNNRLSMVRHNADWVCHICAYSYVEPEPEVSTVQAPATEVPPYDFAPALQKAREGILRFLIPWHRHLDKSWVEHLMDAGGIEQDGCGMFILASSVGAGVSSPAAGAFSPKVGGRSALDAAIRALRQIAEKGDVWSRNVAHGCLSITLSGGETIRSSFQGGSQPNIQNQVAESSPAQNSPSCAPAATDADETK